MSVLIKKFWFVIIILVVYRIGTYIPLPTINASLLAKAVANNSSGVLGVFNMLTGGALGRLSIFALNIMPYITASIVMQLMTVISPKLSAIKKEGEIGRKTINQYTRYLTIVLALFQGYGIAVGAENMMVDNLPIIENPGLYFRLIAAINLLGGTVFVIWLTEQINLYGIGNGSSMIIFAGIVAGLPSSFTSLLEMGRVGAISTPIMFLIVCMCLALIFMITFMEKAQRRIAVTYPKRQIGRKIYGGDTTYLPLKINTSGVIAPIFASSLLLFPTTIISMMGNHHEIGSWQHYLLMYMGHGKVLYVILYSLLILFFTFFYTTIVFNPEETAENLRKAGAVILGRRPGPQTANYLNSILMRITVIGALYVTFICVLPEILIAKYAIPFYLGGTSLLIIVNVVIDVVQQVKTHLVTNKYDALMKNNMLMNRKF